MKECPRCGSSLSRYALSEVEAYGCDSCGWVGIDVEHRSEPVRIESWQDAIRRFHQQFSDSELDEHAENLSRVEAERQAVMAEDEPAYEHAESADSDAVGDGDESGEDEETTTAEEAADEGTADDTESPTAEEDGATATTESDDGTEDGTESEDAADGTDADGADTEADPGAEAAPETAAPTNSQAE
ncbi:zf-TFIIB domain-containing protein [Haloarchaeobius amylolyticus]|uniref:TFIIB-type zinc ribbon-containing protein n=1 Tax=Haloarchaeobius amylolyticus TaxID=1198296 RepID=UPI00226EABCA|nr:zf-TFIIB domain-containing protein [Haloarchaeobius amylolyticus]